MKKCLAILSFLDYGIATYGFAQNIQQSLMSKPGLLRLNYATEADVTRPQDLQGSSVDEYKRKCQELVSSRERDGHRSPTKFEKAWLCRYEELVEFYKEFGHSNVPYNYKNKQLSRWVTNQRHNFKSGKATMTPERIFSLRELNFDFAGRRRSKSWCQKYEELKRYKHMYKHCNVPEKSKKYPDLAKWCKTVQQQYRWKKLSQRKIDALKEIDFQFERPQQHQQHSIWMMRYKEVKRYQLEFGHTRNVRCKSTLRNWIDNQRKAYRLHQQGHISSMNEVKIAHLDSIGFDWCPEQTRWNERFQELKSFQQKFGHSLVTRSSHPHLCSWLDQQGLQYVHLMKRENSTLTWDRVHALQEVGVNLAQLSANFRKQKIPWRTMYLQLKDFSETNGHCRVPQQYPKNPKLGLFVKAQRRQYRLMVQGKKSTLTHERLTALESLGFLWSCHKCTESEYCRPSPDTIALRLALRRGKLDRERQYRLLSKKKQQIGAAYTNASANKLLKIYEKRTLWGSKS